MDNSVGFIGTGIMGHSMAANLIKAGYKVFVWNRTPEKMRDLIAAGAAAVATPAGLNGLCEVVFLSVTDGAAVESLLFSEDGVFHGSHNKTSLIIDCSTIEPAVAKSIATRLLPEVAYVDAPVSGGDSGAKAGTLAVMAGGRKEDFERALPYLSAIGKAITYTGESGTGQLTKCVNQLIVALTVTAMTEGLAFAAAAGLNLETTLSVVSAGAAGSWSLDNYAPRLLKGDRGPGFYAKDMRKDLLIACREAAEIGLFIPASELVLQLYTALLADSEKEPGNHALITLYERVLGRPLIAS